MATLSTAPEAPSPPQLRGRARRASASATGLERPLSPGELFFSFTDEKGVITAGNDVFQRISGYPLAAVARLEELLAGAGYDGYRAFMQAALPAEVSRRAGLLPDSHRGQLLRMPAGAPGAVGQILDRYRTMSQFLDGLIADLTRYAQIGRALADQSAYLKQMGNDVRLFALDAQIGASRLGAQGAALDTVARLLTEQSQATSPLVATVAELGGSAVSGIDRMTFELSLSTIQAEMIAVFAHELADGQAIHPQAAGNMAALAEALQGGSARTFAALNAVADELSAVIEHVDHVGTGIDRLARLALNGRVELASVPDAGPIKSLFSDVDEQVNEARARLTEFKSIQRAAGELKLAAGNDAMHAAASLHASASALS